MPERRPGLETAATPYTGTTLALLTQHGKERVLAPLFLQTLGARVELVTGFDTDTLGTFTREVPRFGSQLEAARQKARVAIERSGVPLGLASEGSFAPGPFGLGSWNLELVVLVDDVRGIELVGRSHAPGLHAHGLVGELDALLELAHRAGFPEHGLVLRSDGESDPRLRKGLSSWPELERAYQQALGESSSGKVFVENDLRAHLHPTRMENIAAAARDLLARASCCCEACGLPGFGVVARVPGLPCRDCGAQTAEPWADELGCVTCSHRVVRPRDPPRRADPSRCDVCNP